MKILFKFPTRERPEKFLKVLDMYLERLDDKVNFEFVISADLDDVTMNNSGMLQEIEHRPNCKIYFGQSKSKIQAVNADMDKCTDWDICLLVSDDMVPITYHLDTIIRDQMKRHFPEGDGALWFNDGKTQNRLNTLVCLDRKYFERFGWLYHPEYTSLWCDNEYTDRGRELGKLKYLERIIIEHIHPAWDRRAKTDKLYQRNEALYKHDEEVYNRRRMVQLSILIPTVVGREEKFQRLYQNLLRQKNRLPAELQRLVDIDVFTDNKELSIGMKRNRMVHAAAGVFVAFVDDDDEVKENYIERLLTIIRENPDIDSIGIRGTMTTDGKQPVNWCVRNIYSWAENQDGFRYVRSTHHWCPIRRVHAMKIGYPDKRFGEDYDYSARLKKSGLIKAEFFLDEDIYHYDYNQPRTKLESDKKYGIVR